MQVFAIALGFIFFGELAIMRLLDFFSGSESPHRRSGGRNFAHLPGLAPVVFSLLQAHA